MIDVGLTTGVKTLWQNASLQDYTLKVENKEFRVHKVVLAAVSNFFQAMLCDSYVESNSDSVTLKGLDGDAVSKLIQFVYTGDENLLCKTDDALEVLKVAMYLQMPVVSEFCAKKLSAYLSIEYCLEIMSVFTEYSFKKEGEEVKKFIKLNRKKVFELHKSEEMAAGEVKALIENWQKSEWEMFLFIKDWFSSNPDNYRDDVNDLLSQVRFCIIPRKEVESIREMDIFGTTEGSWHDLVEKALEYHQMPMHMKVLERSEQAKLRAGPTPVAFFISGSKDKMTFCTLDKENHWKIHEIKGTNSPKCDDECICIQVNDFLVVASHDKNQLWGLFDPRTLTWSLMPKLPKPTIYFSLAHHGEHLYAIGGENIEADHHRYKRILPTDAIVQYSFCSNTWTSFCKLPIMMMSTATCVLGDQLYVSSARTENHVGATGVLYCLDLSTGRHEWEEKTSGEWFGCGDLLSVVNIADEEVLLLVHACLTMSYYSPSKDEWTQLNSRQFEKDDYTREEFLMRQSMKVTHGNSLFVLNVPVEEDDYLYDDEHDEYYIDHDTVGGLCLKWIIPGTEASDVKIDDFPFEECPKQYSSGCCSGILALPCEMFC